MSLFSFVRHELVDIIELPDAPSDMLVSRFERYDDEIKYGAQLIVREGQVAVFINEGKLADVFAPGTYTLETRNLPLLSTLQGWKYGFNSPFKAEVYFLSTRPVLNLQWGTQQPITLNLPGYGLGTVRAFGQVAYQISDAQVFFRQIVGTTAVLVDNDLRNYLRGIIVSQFAQALTESKPTVEQLQANLSAIADTLKAKINAALDPLGFQLTQFFVESLSLPPDLQSQIFEYSRLNNIDLGKLTQLKAAQSITDIAQRSGGSAGGGLGGAVMQLGVGLAAAKQITAALDGSMGSSSMGSTAPAAATPPPLAAQPVASLYHVAIDGHAQGPYTPDQITALIAAGKVDVTTLVWQTGMAAWAPAGSAADLARLFPQQPPPLP